MSSRGPDGRQGEAIDLAAAPIKDFRVRTARARREQTSRRLCAATFVLLQDRELAGLRIDDVRNRAELSRGAFYRYFPTLDALLDYLAGATGAVLNSEMSAQFGAEPDPALRISLHLRYQITRVMSDRPCALVVSRLVSTKGAVSHFARDRAMRDFADAAARRRFDLPSLEVAVDLAHGMLASILRRATLDGLDAERLGLEAAFLLRACGVDPDEARRLAAVPLPPLPAGSLRTQVLDLCSAP